MAHPLSGHLWNAATLALAAAIALAADRLSAAPRGSGTRPVRVADDFGDVASFAVPVGLDSAAASFEAPLHSDPFRGGGDDWDAALPVASWSGNPTVSASASRGHQLTAILIADNRPVAVVDDEVVGVGATLKDGARVSAIQSDRVWVVDKNGKWRMLTLAAGRP